MIPGIQRPVALLGIAEKGYVTLELTARGDGGHTSMPPYDTAVTRLARSITKLQQNPFPLSIEEPVSQMVDVLGPELPFAARVVFANRWIFDPLINRSLSWWYQSNDERSRAINALLRTTIAPTMLQGSSKENVLPIKARALVNIRIHPRDSIETVLKHVSRLIEDEPYVTVAINPSSTFVSNPSSISPTDTEGYNTIERTVREVFPETVVTPYLVIAGTDSRHFAELTEGVYRFGEVAPVSRAAWRFI